MQKILILQGLPASGKSTFAKELMAKEPGKWKRINKDLLRLMFDDSKWSPENEQIVVRARNSFIYQFIRDGFNVIIDDTNFSESHIKVIQAIAGTIKNTDKIDVGVEIKLIDTPVYECIERDSKRKEMVGKKVILGMYNQYLRKSAEAELLKGEDGLPSCIICDIDGTLSHGSSRSPYDYSKVSNDKPNKHLIEILQGFPGYPLFIFTGREGTVDCSRDTQRWLEDNKIYYTMIAIRKDGDHRPDDIIKEEMYNEHIRGKYNVLCVFDDRPKVIRMWKKLGLFVCDVNRQDPRIDF